MCRSKWKSPFFHKKLGRIRRKNTRYLLLCRSSFLTVNTCSKYLRIYNGLEFIKEFKQESNIEKKLSRKQNKNKKKFQDEQVSKDCFVRKMRIFKIGEFKVTKFNGSGYEMHIQKQDRIKAKKLRLKLAFKRLR